MMSATGLGEVADLANTVISRLWPDKTEQERAQLAQAMAIVQGQLDTNKAEAGNPSLFVAGWRPFIGWVCGVGFAVSALGPLLEWGAALAGHPVKFPTPDLSVMMPLMFGMLGLGYYRTQEKLGGINAGH